MAQVTKLPLPRTEISNTAHCETIESGAILTIEDFKAMFADAEARGDFGNAKVLSYRWSKVDRSLQCVVRDDATGALFLYGLGATGKVRRLGAVDH